jgi:cytoskeleton protein RodZ
MTLQVEQFSEPEAQILSLNVGPGSRLRKAREALNLTQEEVAARLRLTRQTIQFIDIDNYNLPAPKTFIRGYLRAYAKLVDVPPDEIVADFELLPVAEHVAQVQLPSPATRQTWRKHESSARWAIYVVAVLGLAIAALGYQWWYSYSKLDAGDSTEKSVNKIMTTAIGSIPPLQLPPVAKTVPSHPKVSAPAPVATLPATPDTAAASNTNKSPAAPVNNTTPMTTAPAPVAASVPMDPAMTTDPVQPSLELRFTGPVTVKLADNTGKVLHEGKYDRNDHVSYDQISAYEILVDQPDNLTVRFHGRVLMPVRYPGEDFARIILQ